MALTSELFTVISALVIGIFGLFILKVGGLIRHCATLNKKLSSIPCLPRHWLLGNSRKGQIEGSRSFLDACVNAANAGHKLFCLWIGPIPIVCVNHADTFKEVIKHTNEKCKGLTDAYGLFDAWLGDGLLVSAKRKWERNRKLLTPAFHFDILNGYIQIMNKSATVFLDKLAADHTKGRTLNVFPYACKTTLDTMLKCSLSYDGNIQKDTSAAEEGYINAIRQIAEVCWRRTVELPLLIKPIFDVHPVGREYYRLCDQVHKFTGAIIESRIEELKEKQPDQTSGKKRHLDFLDILLTAKDEEGNGLSRKEIQDEVDTFVFEGHDTTASAISWSIYALAKYPDLQQKVYKDVCDVLGDSDVVTKDHIGKFTYLPLFLKETMRYFSPVPGIGRASTSSIILDVKEIPPDVSIYIWLYALHHNEDIWPNHMVFDPERFNDEHRKTTDVYGYVPFSAGSRNCIGQVFALNEIKIVLAKFVKRFEVGLDPKGEDPELLPDLIMRSVNGINVCLKTRD